MNGENGEIEGIIQAKGVTGTIQCDHCGYWGEMQGVISPDDDKYIMFLCPKCESFERVVNIFG